MKGIKFHWGTGILIFLILFLLAAGFFISFAMRQEITLVDDDYYERGVEYSDQIRVSERSASYSEALFTHQDESYFFVGVDSALAIEMDSARLLLFRPSNKSLDLNSEFDASRGELLIPKEELTKGRYILKLNWSANGGLKYELERTIVIE